MVNSALNKKFFRSFKQYSIQLFSISIMIMLGVAVYIGLNTTWQSLDSYISKRAKTYNLADLVVVYDPTKLDFKDELKKIDNIKTSEDYLSLRSEVINDSRSELELNFIPENSKINRFQVTKGSATLQGNNCVLDSTYADENNFAVGDRITVSYQGQKKTFKVVGLINSPVYVYSVADSTNVIPNHQKFGFMYTSIENSKSFTGGKILKNKTNISLKNKSQADQTKHEIENIKGLPVLGIIKNSESLNYLATNQKIQQYKSIGNLFPIVFLAVVILMTFTTMYRIINKERNIIGILKALGYSDLKLIVHYLSYGFWVSLIGVLFGTLIGWKIVPSYIWQFFEELFILPDAKITLNVKIVLLVTLISLLSTSVATLYVYSKINNEVPAALLREQKGINGKHILIEKIGNIWSKLLPSYQLMIRQIFTNKVRMLMTIIGVTGCTALLISALGIRDTVDNVAKTVYTKNFLYDEKIVLDPTAKPEITQDYLKKDSSAEQLAELNLPMESSSKKKIGTLHILDNKSKLIKFYKQGKEIELTSKSVLISQKMADSFGLKVGDELEIKLKPDSKINLIVTNITKVNIGQGVYITNSYWQHLGLPFQATSIIKKANSHSFDKNAVIKTINTNDQEGQFINSMKSTISMSIMLITAAAILAVVVLYNLGYLNFAERERDLATLSVLGFFERELKPLLSIENIILSVIGIFVGIPLGQLMHQKIFENAGMGEELDFTPIIYSSSLAVAVIFTMILVLIVNYLLNKKISRIEMTQALKSVE